MVSNKKKPLQFKPTKYAFGKKKSTDLRRPEFRLSDQTPFQITEAYKTVRTNLLYSIAAARNQIIVVTSASPSEGKSTTCTNLAITLAQTAAKVLLIDADLRKPTQHKISKVNNTQGLSKVLVGFDELEDAIKQSIVPNLDLLTAGPNPPNPAELLGSKNMADLLDVLTKTYDFILIDTPPVNVVSDALVLLNDSVGVVLVCRQRQTTYEELEKAVESIRVTNANLLGTVINSVKQQDKMYGGYKSYKRYDYEYGKNGK